MAKKIVDETLKFTIVVNGNEAQKEYGQLQRATKKLTEETKDLEAEAKKLQKANKESSDEYKQLTATINANNKTIEDNEKKMHALTEEIGINNLTMRQLNKEAGRLRGILGNLTPGTDKWEKYNKQLQSVKGRQANLRDEMKATTDVMGKQTGLLAKLKRGFKNLVFPISGAILFADALKKGLQVAKEFISDAIKMSEEAKGVEFAFKRLGEQGEIAFLKIKESTRGLLSDLDIKKSLVEFDNFNISLEETDVLMEFLAVRATQTGQSVDKLKDSLVEGLSKESKLRIDNLGISTAALNAELERTPNFVQAVANIAKTEITRAGSILDDASSSTQRWQAALDNAKVRLGNIINTSGIIPFFQKLGASMLETVLPSEKMVSSIEKQQLGLNQLVTSIIQTNDNEEKRKKLIDELNEKYPFFNQFIKDEDTNNKNLQTALNNVNKLYIKRLAIQQLEADLKIEAKKANEAKQTVKLTEAEIQREAVLNKINTALAKKNKSVEIGNTVDETSKRLKERLYSEEIRLTQLQDKRTNNDNKLLAFVKKAQDAILESERITAGASSRKDFAESDLTEAEKRVAEIERRLGLSKDQLDTVFSQKEVVITNAPETDDEKKAREQRLNEIKQNEQQITEFLAQEKLKRELDSKIGIQREFAEIDAKYQAQLDKEVKNGQLHDELIKLRDQEKADLKIQREKELADRLNQLEEENYVAKEAARLEREALEAETQTERDALLLERENLLAQQKIDIELYLAEERLRITGASEAEIAALRDKYRIEQEAQDFKSSQRKKQIAKDEADFKKQQKQQELQSLSRASGQLAQLLGEQSAEGKAFASMQAIVNTYLGASQVLSDPKVPVFLKPFLVGTTIALGLKQVAEINKAKKPAVQGFEEGLYPVTRAQDGKRFNTQLSTDTSTRLVNKPTTLVGERPEMIIDPNTLNRMNPNVIDYILQLAGKRPIQGFERGDYNVKSNNNNVSLSAVEGQTPTNNNQQEAVMQMLAIAVNRLVDEGVEAYVNYDLQNERERQKLQDKLNQTLNTAKN